MGEKLRKIQSSEIAHESVKERIADGEYSPQNLPKDIAYI